jgi:multidrug resistance efflux pump
MQRQSNRRVISIAVLIVALGVIAALGFRYWYQPTYDFVEVDDAQVTGYLTRVAAPASGQVEDLEVNVGDTVRANQVIATIQVIASTPGNAAAAPSVSRLLAHVTSPVDGRVAARMVSVGDTVAAGQTIVTVADLSNLWIDADVDETRIGQVAPNQRVDVSVGAIGQVLHGQVADIGSATTEVASPPPPGGFASSDSTKKIPVRIAVDWNGTQPLPGMTAAVTIYVR